MTLTINKKLYFVMPRPVDGGATVHVHAAPISLDTFEEFALVLAQTHAVIHQQGLGPTSGPRVAAMLLKETAQALGEATWKKVQAGLIAEIHRLTHVIALGDRGWETLPYDVAVKNGTLDEDDVSEVENGLVFFTLGWRLYPKTIRTMMLEQAAKLWGGSTSSSNSTEYAASLETPSGTESSGVKKVAESSAPS